jgi:hypothetical protein
MTSEPFQCEQLSVQAPKQTIICFQFVEVPSILVCVAINKKQSFVVFGRLLHELTFVGYFRHFWHMVVYVSVADKVSLYKPRTPLITL